MARQRARTAILLLLLATALPAAAQHHDKHDERALHEAPRLAPGQIAPMKGSAITITRSPPTRSGPSSSSTGVSG